MLNKTITYLVKPSESFKGILSVSGDKSISHRAIILAALAQKPISITGFLPGEDNLATLAAFQALGVKIEQHNSTNITLHGVGYHGLIQPSQPLNMGNSGTAMRILTGVLCGQSFSSTLMGDESLSRRPMQRILDPLRQMGADIESQSNGTAPLVVKPVKKLQGIHYRLPMASAQVKSALIMAGLYAEGGTIIQEPGGTRDHTERMLAWLGNPISQTEYGIRVNQLPLQGKNIDIPGDLSSAAFFIIGAAISPDSNVTISGVGLNSTRTGIIDILRLMGADITISNLHSVCGEPRGDLCVRYAPLKGIDIPDHLVPLAIDEFPAIFIASACAQGTTRIQNAQELLVKESNRLAAMAEGLQQLGINAVAGPGTMTIQGGQLKGGEVDSHGDHRIAMAFSIAGLRASHAITVKDCANVATSFPEFLGKAQALGLDICAYEA